MTQEKIIIFITSIGEQLAVHRIGPFANLQDEFTYYQQYWANPDIVQLYATAYYKLEFLKSNPFFEQMEKLWIAQEVNKLSNAFGFSGLESQIMPYIMEGKSVKEIANLLGHARSTTGNCITRMNEKAGILNNGSAKKLKLFFLIQIYS